MANIKSFPNNQDTYVGAEDVMRWLYGRTSGVFGAEGNASVSPVDNTMAVTVSDGNGWMSNSNGYGVVWWNDTESSTGSKLRLTVSTADASRTRIDRVIVSWQTTNYVALPEIKILKGTAASNPSAPALTNNSTLRQISLAKITIPAGSTAITSSMITDERLNSSVCGLVTCGIGVDTSVMQNQFESLLTAIENELSSMQAGTNVEMKKLSFTNVSVKTSAFVSDTTYAEYPYRASVALSGVIASMIPEVVFSLADAISGNFAPVVESYNGGVYIYAMNVPSANITIPTIIAWKGN